MVVTKHVHYEFWNRCIGMHSVITQADSSSRYTSAGAEICNTAGELVARFANEVLKALFGQIQYQLTCTINSLQDLNLILIA